MLQKIIAYVEKNKMLQLKDKVVIGISGGADSVCLFFILLELQKRYQLQLFAVHVNHGLRGKEADGDEAYVVQIAQTHKVPITVVKADVGNYAKKMGLSEEEAGRKLRYEAFYREFKTQHCNKIAVAHNENDQAETVLFHLFRGSGLKGLTGISAVRDEIIRPLLCLSRLEIEEYLKNRNITYRTDSTNLCDKYARNKLRLKVLPYLTEEINAQAVRHIVDAAGMLRESDEYIEKNAEILFKRIVKVENNTCSVEIKAIEQEHIVMQKKMVQRMIQHLANQLKDIEAEHIMMVLGLMNRMVGKQVDLPYNICAVREYDALQLFVKKQDSSSTGGLLCVPLEIPGIYEMEPLGMSIHLEILERREKNVVIPKNDCTKWFDYDKIKNTIFIRNRQMGDYIQVDSAGGHKKLKDYFIDKKFPKAERDLIPLLADGSHIIWILGDRISEYYKVGEETTKILMVKLDGGITSGRQN
jgi:tRNA(Ile)-lysidine synthetase, N-terminal domain/tRNA(Ile)-lysidine synthetase, C-terminal domain